VLADRRLVTLAGPGGAGKTRLALEVAERVVGNHPDGIRLVELAPLVDHEVVVDEVAQRFGATRVEEVPLAETIADTIGIGGCCWSSTTASISWSPSHG
jgi:predicted ATPase